MRQRGLSLCRVDVRSGKLLWCRWTWSNVKKRAHRDESRLSMDSLRQQQGRVSCMDGGPSVRTTRHERAPCPTAQTAYATRAVAIAHFTHVLWTHECPKQIGPRCSDAPALRRSYHGTRYALSGKGHWLAAADSWRTVEGPTGADPTAASLEADVEFSEEVCAWSDSALGVFLDGGERVEGSAPVRWLLVLLEERLDAFDRDHGKNYCLNHLVFDNSLSGNGHAKPGVQPSAILHRTPFCPPIATSGQGINIISDDGRTIIDMCTVQHATIEELANHVVASCKGAFELVGSVSGGISGSEVMEGVIKNARQYFVEIGQPQRRNFIARQLSFHENTIATLRLAYHPTRRAPYAALFHTQNFHHVSPAYAARFKGKDETEEEYGRNYRCRCPKGIFRGGEVGLRQVRCSLHSRRGHERYGRTYWLPFPFSDMLMLKLRHGHSVRMGELRRRCLPDLQAVAKGLGSSGGSVRLRTALQASRRWAPRRLRVLNARAQSNTRIPCVATLTVQKNSSSRNSYSRTSRHLGALLRSRLTGRHACAAPHVWDICGGGARWTVECDSTTEKAVQSGYEGKTFALDVQARIGEHHGRLQGLEGNHCMFSPAYDVTKEEVKKIVDIFIKSVEEKPCEIGSKRHESAAHTTGEDVILPTPSTTHLLSKLWLRSCQSLTNAVATLLKHRYMHPLCFSYRYQIIIVLRAMDIFPMALGRLQSTRSGMTGEIYGKIYSKLKYELYPVECSGTRRRAYSQAEYDRTYHHAHPVPRSRSVSLQFESDSEDRVEESAFSAWIRIKTPKTFLQYQGWDLEDSRSSSNEAPHDPPEDGLKSDDGQELGCARGHGSILCVTFTDGRILDCAAHGEHSLGVGQDMCHSF
ncbi:pyridoxal phosphate-dependent transferase [Fomes fomentarius]|nr:pyridoxal phosphate-dependent transferase [Fomes fomentarius]